MRLKGKSCIVTGAARGIGKGIGLRLIAEGVSVVFADLNGDQADEAATEARDSGGQAIRVSVDVAERDQVRSMIESTVAEFGKLDIIFNNAGINTIQRFLDATEENFNRIMRVNALGVLGGRYPTLGAARPRNHGVGRHHGAGRSHERLCRDGPGRKGVDAQRYRGAGGLPGLFRFRLHQRPGH